MILFRRPHRQLVPALQHWPVLLTEKTDIIITAASTALFPLPPPEFIAARVFNLAIGEKCDMQQLLARLISGGYVRVERVQESGEFAVYGGQVDIFPPDAEDPFRLVMMDDEIEQIRIFSVQTQRSLRQVPNIRACRRRSAIFQRPVRSVFVMLIVCILTKITRPCFVALPMSPAIVAERPRAWNYAAVVL